MLVANTVSVDTRIVLIGVMVADHDVDAIMVGCFQRKSTCSRLLQMAEKTEKKRSGVFHSKSGGDYVVLWQGQEVARYATMEEFVEVHQAGLLALEENQADLLETYYQSIGISTGKSPGRSGRP